MKLKKYVYSGITGVIAIVVIIVALSQFNILSIGNQQSQETNSSLYLDFSYEEANLDIKNTLKTQQINMSNILRFSSQSDINQYCNFLTDPKKQALIKFCTSTELQDKQGFLGNINMVGSPESPGLVIAALQSNPFLSNYADVKTVFGAVINNTICQCWDKEQPRGYSTLSAMIDAFRDFHINGKRPDSTTHTIPLGGKHFEIELTTNTNGYLWKLLIAR